MMTKLLRLPKNPFRKHEAANTVKTNSAKAEGFSSTAQLIVDIRSREKISHRRDLEKLGLNVRNSKSRDFAISGNNLSNIAVLGLGGTEAAILVSEKAIGGKDHINIRNAVIDSGLSIRHESRADHSAIVELNDALSVRANINASADPSLLLDEIFKNAVDKKATDVHICTREKTGMILFRVNSKVYQHRRYDAATCEAMASYMFTKLANPSSRSTQNFNLQMGSMSCMIRTIVNGAVYNVRYKFLSVEEGFDVVLRILKVESDKDEKLNFEKLGYESTQISLIERAIRKSMGLIAITGTTGSGKSTTLKVMMESDPERHLKKRYSVEDPVEYKIYGVSQLSVRRNDRNSEGAEETFVGVLRDLLRADPDDVMVGETRDEMTAKLVADAVLTGHKIYTTLHTSDAITTFVRMDRLGVDRSILTQNRFVAVLLNQCLMPVLCPHCKKPALGSDRFTKKQQDIISNKFHIPLDGLYVAHPEGCEKCYYGYIKSTVIAEVIAPDDQMRKLIAEGKDDDALMHYRLQRKSSLDDADMTGKICYEHALYKMSQGLIDPNDVEVHLGHFDEYRMIEN